MAKVTITIDDNPDGSIQVVVDPPFNTMMMMVQSGHELKSSHTYALRAINAIQKLSTEADSKTKILIPRLV